MSRRGGPWADRFRDRVDTSGGPNACWPMAGKPTRTGYAFIAVSDSEGKRRMLAHRAAWMLANPGAALPAMLDHLCHDPAECRGGPTCPHRRCCNPAHLAPTTPRENGATDRRWSQRQRGQCLHGHEYTPENTRWWTDTRTGRSVRICRSCTRIHIAEKRLRDLADVRPCEFCGKRLRHDSLVAHVRRKHGARLAA